MTQTRPECSSTRLRPALKGTSGGVEGGCVQIDLGAGERHWMCWRLVAVPESVGIARQVAREFLTRDADEVLLEQTLLTTSELITNAIKYGRGWRPVYLHVALTADHVAVTVANSTGEAWVGNGGDGLPPDTSEGGRGLHIVRELNDEFAVFHGRVTIVRAAQRREGSPGSRP